MSILLNLEFALEQLDETIAELNIINQNTQMESVINDISSAIQSLGKNIKIPFSSKPKKPRTRFFPTKSILQDLNTDPDTFFQETLRNTSSFLVAVVNPYKIGIVPLGVYYACWTNIIDILINYRNGKYGNTNPNDIFRDNLIFKQILFGFGYRSGNMLQTFQFIDLTDSVKSIYKKQFGISIEELYKRLKICGIHRIFNERSFSSINNGSACGFSTCAYFKPYVNNNAIVSNLESLKIESDVLSGMTMKKMEDGEIDVLRKKIEKDLLNDKKVKECLNMI